MIQCVICFNKMIEAGSSVWCEYCLYGESLVFPGRLHAANKTTGLEEAHFWTTKVGKDVLQHYLMILDKVCESPEVSLMEIFSGSGGFIIGIEPYINRSAGYEPLKEVFNAAQQFLGSTNSIDCTLPAVEGLDILCILNDFTSIERPEKLVTLLHPRTIVVECPIFDGKPQEMAFWNKAVPREHCRYYTEQALTRQFTTQGYSLKGNYSAFPGTYVNNENKNDKVFVFEKNPENNYSSTIPTT